MKIAVYSGSFNPLHIGHLAIIKYLVGQGRYDVVYLIVSPKNPLKDSIDSSTGLDRYNAALDAVKRHFPLSEVHVDDIELNMPEPHYTINTLDALKNREPDNDFTFVMGADSLDNIRKWKDYSRILGDYGVVVYPREGYDLQKVRQSLLDENSAYRIEVLEAPEVTVSSTEIRESISRGEDVSNLIM